MKIKDIPVLKQKVLAVLPIKQSELWKILNIDHRDVSELVGIMVKEQLIKKTKIAHTFLIESPNGDKEQKNKDLTPLISGTGKFSPCSGCSDECSPTECKKLTEWVLDIEKVEKEEKMKSELKNEKIENEQIKNHEKLIKDIKDDDNKINKKYVKHKISIKKIRKDMNIEKRNNNLIAE